VLLARKKKIQQKVARENKGRNKENLTQPSSYKRQQDKQKLATTWTWRQGKKLTEKGMIGEKLFPEGTGEKRKFKTTTKATAQEKKKVKSVGREEEKEKHRGPTRRSRIRLAGKGVMRVEGEKGKRTFSQRSVTSRGP